MKPTTSLSERYSGELERAFPLSEWESPLIIGQHFFRKGSTLSRDVRAARSFDALVFPRFGKTRPVKRRRAMLHEFLLLARKETTNGDILKYASTWGVLGLCWHWQPFTHSRNCLPAGVEPVERWRQIAMQFRAIHDAAQSLRFSSAAPSFEVCSALIGPHTERAHAACSARSVRLFVSLRVGQWLEAANVRPVIIWDDVKPRLEYGSWAFPRAGALPGALALQLAFAVADRDDLYECSNCGDDYKPKRRISPPHYCLKKACQRVANSTRQKRYRDSKKGDRNVKARTK
jgi:hypothetical protein